MCAFNYLNVPSVCCALPGSAVSDSRTREEAIHPWTAPCVISVEGQLPPKERTELQAPLHLGPRSRSRLDLGEGVEQRPRRQETLVLIRDIDNPP